MAKKTKGVPTNLAFARHIEPSDGCMYRTRWENRTSLEPLRLGTKTMRTVLSNRVKKNDEEKNDGKALKKQNEGDWQIHSVNYCTLGPDYDTLAVKFTLKFLGGIGNPHCCNDAAYRLGLKEKVDEYIKDSNDFYGLGDLALRYARNIAAASFLWRNRIGAERIETEVADITCGGSGEKLVFDSLDISLDFYEEVKPGSDLAKLGYLIYQTLADKDVNAHLQLEITSRVQLGWGREVFPSEMMLDKADKTGNDRPLHSVDGYAAMTSQKIGNKIRCIDTWYSRYAEEGVVLPVEAYGTCTGLGEVFRPSTSPECFYRLYDGWMAGEEISPDDKDYVIAMLIRGGVFGDSDK